MSALGLVLVACGGGGAGGKGEGTGKAKGPCILSHQEVNDALAPDAVVITESGEPKPVAGISTKGICVYKGMSQHTPASRSVPLTISTRVSDDDDLGQFRLTVAQGEPVDLGDEAAVDSTGKAVMRLGSRYYSAGYSAIGGRTNESGAVAILRVLAAKVK